MTVTGDLFNIGTTALVSYQRILATTSHNISNVENENYSRQRVQLGTNTPTYSGFGFMGTGVHTNTVERLYSEFLTNNVRDHLSDTSELDTYYRYAQQIDDMVADPNVGLQPAVENFFNAVHDVANSPTSVPARQVMLSQGENLADRFHYLNNRVVELDGAIGDAMTEAVSEINSLAQNIASLNKDIVFQQGRSGGNHLPNDLLDQRDAAVAQLAQLVKVTSYQQDDGSMNIFIGSGQNLVLGQTYQQLDLISNTYDASHREVAFKNTTQPITDFMKGGELGGLIRARDELMAGARDELGRIAIGVVQTFNEQHAQGMDLNGLMGGDFFYDMNNASLGQVQGPQVLADAANTSGAVATASFTTIANLRDSNYTLENVGGNYVLTRLSDGTTQSIAVGAVPQTLDFSATEGFSIAVTGAAALAGESFLIRPFRNGAGDINVKLTEPSGIAAAAPFRITEQDNGLGTPSNTGTAVVSPGVMSNATGNTLTAALGVGSFLMDFENGGGGTANTFWVDAPPAGTANFDVQLQQADGTWASVWNAGTQEFTYNPANGGTYRMVMSDTGGANFGDITFSINGTPTAGDQFVIGDNAVNNAGVGDSRNALSLASLQTQKTMLISGGTADYQEVYGNMVADIGIRTSQTKINQEAQNSLLQKAQDQRDEVSGVNLDEEAANLIRYQNAYQAAAQVFSVGRDVFQTLLGAIGR